MKLFKTYPSIENSYRDMHLLAVKSFIQLQDRPDKIEWFVTEKIHGANSQFWCDGKEVLMGKRTAFLSEDDNFYGASRVLAKYKEAVLELFELVNRSYDSKVTTMTLYGELFGGMYPGTPNDNQSKQVQKGVHYCPHNEFMGFDLAVRMGEDEQATYVNHLIMLTALKTVGIPGIPVLKVGTLNECLEYPNEFSTTIPAMFELDELEDNTCEGVVIKPSRSLFLPDGKRAIFKNKNTKFSEREQNPKKKSIAPVNLEPETLEAVNILASYLNENRVIAVISKFGEPEFKQFGAYLKELNEDILLDANKDHSSQLAALPKDRMSLVTKSLNKLSSGMVREYLKKNS